MDSMDNFRDRFEALEQRTEHLQQHICTVERRLRWWRGIACGMLLLGLVSLRTSAVRGWRGEAGSLQWWCDAAGLDMAQVQQRIAQRYPEVLAPTQLQLRLEVTA
jgi:hypothetical protein